MRYHVHPLYIRSQGYQMFQLASRCLRRDSLVQWIYFRLHRVKILLECFSEILKTGSVTHTAVSCFFFFAKIIQKQTILTGFLQREIIQPLLSICFYGQFLKNIFCTFTGMFQIFLHTIVLQNYHVIVRKYYLGI